EVRGDRDPDGPFARGHPGPVDAGAGTASSRDGGGVMSAELDGVCRDSITPEDAELAAAVEQYQAASEAGARLDIQQVVAAGPPGNRRQVASVFGLSESR